MSQSCDRALLVQADFDGELDAVQAGELQIHRASCPICQATYQALEHTRAALRQAEVYQRAPAALRQAIAARIVQSPPAPTVGARLMAWWTRPISGFGMGAAVMAVLAWLVLAPTQQTIFDQVLSSHVRALQPGHLTDVVSSDHHTVRPWFEGKLDFAPPVKDLAAQDFPLKGGRLDYLDGRSVAALVYQHGAHPINLFVWPEKGASNSAPSASERNGYNIVHWQQNGMTFWAISDLDRSELEEFARDWRDAP